MYASLGLSELTRAKQSAAVLVTETNVIQNPLNHQCQIKRFVDHSTFYRTADEISPSGNELSQWNIIYSGDRHKDFYSWYLPPGMGTKSAQYKGKLQKLWRGRLCRKYPLGLLETAYGKSDSVSVSTWSNTACAEMLIEKLWFLSIPLLLAVCVPSPGCQIHTSTF